MAKNDTETQAPPVTAKLSLPTLTTMVVGSINQSRRIGMPRSAMKRFASPTVCSP